MPYLSYLALPLNTDLTVGISLECLGLTLIHITNRSLIGCYISFKIYFVLIEREF